MEPVRLATLEVLRRLVVRNLLVELQQMVVLYMLEARYMRGHQLAPMLAVVVVPTALPAVAW